MGSVGGDPVNLENIIREEAERRAGIEAPTVLETVVVVGLLVLAFAFVVWAVVVTS